MPNYKRITQEEADALIAMGVDVIRTDYYYRIRWSSDNPVYVGSESLTEQTLCCKPDGFVRFRRIVPLPVGESLGASYLPTYTVGVE